jgi:hypothetical protein
MAKKNKVEYSTTFFADVHAGTANFYGASAEAEQAPALPTDATPAWDEKGLIKGEAKSEKKAKEAKGKAK